MSAFNIKYSHGAYYVSIPHYNGGTVYPAEDVEALVTIATRLAEGERSDEGHTALRDAARAALAAAKGE